MRTAKRLIGGFFIAVALAFVLAWLNAGRAEAGVLIPTGPLTPEEKAYKEWCANLPNWQYLMNPGCWIYF